MKEHPILFNGQMVRAILAGRKTQTRRVLKDQPPEHYKYERSPGNTHVGYIAKDQPMIWAGEPCWRYGAEWGAQPVREIPWPNCPYGKPGDRLWVREAWANMAYECDEPLYTYKADTPAASVPGWSLPPGVKWKPSIHMPKAASRITLEITDVRVERLQEISDQDCVAEGIDVEVPNQPVQFQFSQLWDSINKDKHPWVSNPWVWVVEFERV